MWPRPLRRSRRLHDYGLEVLLRLGPTELAGFFDAFFDLPVERVGAVPAGRHDRRRGQPDDDGGAAAAAVVAAAPTGGEPASAASLIERRTASTQPTATAMAKMNHCTA